ncbi:hypothetical protein T4E_9313 [Trichinella pseudospiralis]|uniref:Uncharacterized protein n=1 Tax=Trichinella pseudospiralis TaxID=6337 RepID=A0A0V0XDE3_TRIPS|nr:hypothetical protein T4E_9313 [Trichinella pseudospiralis]
MSDVLALVVFVPICLSLVVHLITRERGHIGHNHNKITTDCSDRRGSTETESNPPACYVLEMEPGIPGFVLFSAIDVNTRNECNDWSSAAINLAIQLLNFLSSVVRQPSEERWEAEQHKAAQRCRKKKIFAWRDYPIHLDVMVDRSECSKECQQSLVDVLYRYFPCKSFQASRIGMNAFLGTLSFEPDNLKAWHLMMSDFRCVSALRCVEWRKIRVENLKKKVRKQTFALNAFGKVNRSTEADLLFILGNGLETVLVSTRPVEVCNAREAASPRDHYSGSGSRITAKYCP